MRGVMLDASAGNPGYAGLVRGRGSLPGCHAGWPTAQGQSAGLTIRDLIHTSRHALEMACGLSFQLEVIPATERLPGLHHMHVFGFIPMSYHVLTAAGAAETMVITGPTVPLLVLVVGCI